MDALLNALTNQFEQKFWESIESIFESIHYLERQALIWQALKGKDKLIVQAQSVREQLVKTLAETHTKLVSELNAEREALSSSIGSMRLSLGESVDAAAQSISFAFLQQSEFIGVDILDLRAEMDAYFDNIKENGLAQ